jgi:predicted YcjX-like family ATPase
MASLYDWAGLRDLGLPSAANLQGALGELADLAFDRTLRLAVTGLRQSGKTVFITTLVHHLLAGQELPFLAAAKEGRLRGARLLPPRAGDPPSFPFAAARNELAAPEPGWPAPTHALASLRLAIRFAPTGLFRRQLAEHRTLHLEIIDYPGEWLLDLPLLERDFESWSRDMLSLAEAPPRARLAKDWRDHLATLDPSAPASEEAAAKVAGLYTRYLLACQQEEGLSFLQPGRFTMPGELAGSELLRFCPLPPGPAPRGSLAALMAERYDRYRRRVVAPFYRNHFAHFDRQVVLADLLAVLNRGRACFEDAQRALSAVLESFRYGRSNRFWRLISPRIETVLFAATKADHVAHNQHHNLRLLLEHMIADAAGRPRFEGITPAFIALAALRSTDVVRTEHHGQVLSCVRGVLKGEARETILFPGEIPPDLPAEEDWQSGRFRFRDFAPRRLQLRGADKPQHIRLDQALDVLLGDRLR